MKSNINFYWIKRFWHDDSGVASIEAAISYPVGFLIFLGMIDLSLMLYANAALNNSAKDIAYEGAVQCQVDERDASGNCKTGTDRFDETFIKQTLGRYSVGLLKPDQLCIHTCVVQSRFGSPTCNTQANSSGLDLGGTEDAIRYEFTYEYRPFIGFMRKFFPNLYRFQSVYVVRNGGIVNNNNKTLVWNCTI